MAEPSDPLATLPAEQAARWRAGDPVRAEALLAGAPGLGDADALVLIMGEAALRRERGERPSAAEYQARFPRLAELLAVQFQLEDALAGLTLSSAASAPAPPAVPGYEVLGELGRGGMGVVYLARQEHLDRTVAIKVIRTGPWSSAAERDRFLRETRLVAGLRHPGIIELYTVGEHAGRPFFAMEYAPGGGLDQRFAGQ